MPEAAAENRIRQYFDEFVAANDVYAPLRVSPASSSDSPTGTVLYECGRRIAEAAGKKGNAFAISQGVVAAARALKALDPQGLFG